MVRISLISKVIRYSFGFWEKDARRCLKPDIEFGRILKLLALLHIATAIVALEMGIIIVVLNSDDDPGIYQYSTSNIE